MEYTGEQRRKHFRVEYPLVYRPRFTLNGNKFPVLDISEKGVRFVRTNKGWTPEVQRVKGAITFHDEQSYFLTGSIVRQEDNQVALYLDEGLPFKRVMAEQQYLIRRFIGYRD